ncbi:MAG TPA: heme biosynthesis HemY N-terminal domain-containing protein [Rhodocyclaceae bacterium]|nr:heme biosynthesis HemY N-terminal domain-containing protein [Rhodocyclaceae bacterium]
MRALLWLLTLAAMAVGLALAARYNEGYALLVLPPWRVELSLNLLIVLAVAAFAVLHLVLRGAAAMAAMPGKVAAFRARQAQLKAESALRDAMRLLFEGRYSQSLKRAEAAWEAGHAPGLAALLAARSAQLMRDEERQALWSDRALVQDDEVHNARLMVEAVMAVEGRDFDKARVALDQLTRESGRHIAALRLSLRTQQGLGNWHAALRILRQLEKHRAMTADQAAVLRRRVHREILRDMSNLGDDGAALARYLRDMDEADRQDPAVAGASAKALLVAGATGEAARVIEEALDEQWDSELLNIYGQAEGGDVLGRLSHAERWLAQHPRDARLLLALGRLCRQRDLWGKAQSYLEASLAVTPSREAHVELARLLDYLEKPEEANRHYRAAALTSCA